MIKASLMDFSEKPFPFYTHIEKAISRNYRPWYQLLIIILAIAFTYRAVSISTLPERDPKSLRILVEKWTT